MEYFCYALPDLSGKSDVGISDFPYSNKEYIKFEFGLFRVSVNQIFYRPFLVMPDSGLPGGATCTAVLNTILNLYWRALFDHAACLRCFTESCFGVVKFQEAVIGLKFVTGKNVRSILTGIDVIKEKL
ncbi:hypothetical protein AAKU67_001275 [Oxalobacteraceae bacterium GrIS 2.11]